MNLDALFTLAEHLARDPEAARAIQKAQAEERPIEKSDYDQNRRGRIVHVHNKVLPRGQEQLPAGVVRGGKAEIAALLNNAANGFTAVRFGDVDTNQARRIHNATGFEVEGFHHRIDLAAINHVRKHHGPGREDDPALEPITDDDILAIQSIVANPDHIERGKDQDTGLPSIIYTKKMGDTFVMVEEIRYGRRELALKTLMKRRAKNDPGGRP